MERMSEDRLAVIRRWVERTGNPMVLLVGECLAESFTPRSNFKDTETTR